MAALNKVEDGWKAKTGIGRLGFREGVGYNTALVIHRSSLHKEFNNPYVI
jgi:hypothetical protein